MLNALKSYGVPLKYCRLVRAIYDSAKVRVRIQEKSGERMYSRNVDIRRGVIQGDIPSPVCFLIALDKLLKDHGALNQGIQINEYLVLSHLAFADDAALGNANAEEASARLTHKPRKKQGWKYQSPRQRSSISRGNQKLVKPLKQTLITYLLRKHSSTNVINAT